MKTKLSERPLFWLLMALLSFAGSITITQLHGLIGILPFDYVTLFVLTIALSVLTGFSLYTAIWKKIMQLGGGEEAVRETIRKNDEEDAAWRKEGEKENTRRIVAYLRDTATNDEKEGRFKNVTPFRRCR